jgi:prepilin-type N-terminal cleavage/methylation domain-containing protein
VLVRTPGRTGAAADDAGFTLIELIAVMTVGGVLLAMSGFGFVNYRNTAQQQGSTDQLVSALRNASVRAISEGRTYCVDVAPDGRSYQLWRVACDTATGTPVAAPAKVQGGAVTLAATVPFPASAVPAPLCPTTHRCLSFSPRGTAVPARIVVSSTARQKTYTVRVEGLTARVYR